MVELDALGNDFGHPVSTLDLRNSAYAERKDFLGELTDAVRDNPLPAALIGMGLLWMFTGGSKTSVGDAMTSRAPGVMAGSLARGAGKVRRSVMHGAGKLGSSIADVAQGSMDAVAGAADRVGHALSPSSDQKDHAGYGSRDYAGNEWYERDRFSEYDPNMPQSPQNGVQQRISEFFEQRPLVLGAAGLALGAGIAASLPVSETEQQAFGKASDMLRNKVSDVMGQAKDMATAVADEAAAQGLSADSIRHGLSDISGKSVKPTGY